MPGGASELEQQGLIDAQPIVRGTSALVRSMAAVVPLVARACHHRLWRRGPARSGWWAALSATPCSAFMATLTASWRPSRPAVQPFPRRPQPLGGMASAAARNGLNRLQRKGG